MQALSEFLLIALKTFTWLCLTCVIVKLVCAHMPAYIIYVSITLGITVKRNSEEGFGVCIYLAAYFSTFVFMRDVVCNNVYMRVLLFRSLRKSYNSQGISKYRTHNVERLTNWIRIACEWMPLDTTYVHLLINHPQTHWHSHTHI